MNHLNKVYKKISLVSVAVVMIFIYLSFYISYHIFINLELFFQTHSVSQNIILALIVVVVIIVSILISIILHLLETSKIRVEMSLNEKMEPLLFSQAQFQRLFEFSPVPYIVLNQKGEIKDLNKACIRFFNVKSEDLIMKNFFDYVADDDLDVKDQITNFYNHQSTITNKQVTLKGGGGNMRYVELSFFNLSSNGGKYYSGLLSFFDITEQKKLDQAKTEFISLASHQLRTPLATTKWYTEMLLLPSIGELNIKQRDYIKIISDVNLGMIDLVDTLLNVSRSEIGTLSVELMPTNIKDLIENILVELSSQIQKKNMNIIREYDESVSNINTDPKILRIVIHNLITNSIKYTPEGGNITISFSENSGKYKISVADTGYGIPVDQQDKIFTKLFRADNVKDVSSSQSTGLGLYLIKSIITTIGGSIAFHSVENQGTTFTITL